MTLDAVGVAVKFPHHGPAVRAGAECWRCSLLNCNEGPVPPSVPEEGSIEFLVVGEAPGPVEVEEGKTLVGPSGREIRNALRDAGLPADRISYTNTMLCRPPGGDLERYLRDLNRLLKKTPLDANLGVDLGAGAVASPIECCRPRLLRELSRARYAVLMGGASLAGAGVGGKIMKLRGTPVQIPGGPPAMPVPHAAFVLRDAGRTFRPLFRMDVGKAVQIAYHGSSWRDPSYFVARDAAQLANFLLGRPHNFLAVDTETDGIDPWTCNLRRIGIGNAQEVAIYAPLSVRGHALLSIDERETQKRVFAEAFQRPILFGFHNYYGFDSIILRQHGLTLNDDAVFDSLLGHHIGATSELPHTLSFLGSTYTDAPYWKDDVKHTKIREDAVLDRYLSFDVAVTRLAAPQVWHGLEHTGQTAIYGLDERLSRVGRSMAALGITIDRQAQWAFAAEYQERADRLRAEFVEACGREVNPRSYPQVTKLLFQDLGLPVLEEHLTETGEPSSAEPVLLALLGMGVDKRAETVIHTLLGFREADKVLGTYTGRIETVDEETGQTVPPRLVGGPPLHGDGRLRTTWKVYGTTSGRWSSGDPMNLQNVIKKLRSMFVPAPGNVFVAADSSALELRILAHLADDETLIEAFAAFDDKRGPDVHVVNACTLFRCQPSAVNDEVRTFTKRFIYALSYGAAPPKIHQTLSLLRDDNLRPVFPHITLAEVERVYDVWWTAHPKILDWQKGLIRSWRRGRYLATPWHGRRRYFIGGENHEEMKNFPIQGGAADLQNQAVLALVDSYPFDFARRRGLVLQVHDQLVVECASDEADRVKKLVEAAMTRRIGSMLFPAKANAGKNWKEVS